MSCPSLIVRQLDCLIQVVDTNSCTNLQTVQIQIQKPTDLGLHCLQRQGISGFSRTRVNIIVLKLVNFNIAVVKELFLTSSS